MIYGNQAGLQPLLRQASHGRHGRSGRGWIRRRRYWLGAVCFILFSLTSCGSSPASPLTVFCSPDSPRMREAIAGVQAGLAGTALEVVCVPEFGPQAEDGLRRVRRGQPRLLVVLGTPALMQVAPREKRLPVVFALVANPYFTGAAYEPEHPETHQENVTGIYSPPPVAAALEQGKHLLGTGTWGLLVDPLDGTGREVEELFATLGPRSGIQPLVERSSDGSGDRLALERLLTRGARVVYLPPAKSVRRYAALVLERGRQGQVLVVNGNPEITERGAALTVILDYRKLGEEAAALARRVLAGEKPAKIPLSEKTPLRIQVDEALLQNWLSYPAHKVAPKR